ncbi:MAG: hypothetical protein KAI86_16705, partial [Desulfobacterales bacterium]|nr:hypothetical protein [Desulfobacterales bacterium]
QITVCRHWFFPLFVHFNGVLEYWSTGVLGLKAEKYLIFYSFTLAFPRFKHGSYLSIIPTIHHSITPVLQPITPLLLPITSLLQYSIPSVLNVEPGTLHGLSYNLEP